MNEKRMVAYVPNDLRLAAQSRLLKQGQTFRNWLIERLNVLDDPDTHIEVLLEMPKQKKIQINCALESQGLTLEQWISARIEEELA